MEFMRILYFDVTLKVAILLVVCELCSIEKLNAQQTKPPYEQITFVELVRKYVEKDASRKDSIEGIYSVSASATKESKRLFSSARKEKTLDQKDNYAVVAIISDGSKNSRDYIEVPIDKDNLISYPIRGELTTSTDGNVLMFKHFEPKGKILSYSLVYDRQKNMIEGIRTETSSGGAIYTYKITFQKVLPKATSGK